MNTNSLKTFDEYLGTGTWNKFKKEIEMKEGFGADQIDELGIFVSFQDWKKKSIRIDTHQIFWIIRIT
jgi:hypothetical protein